MRRSLGKLKAVSRQTFPPLWQLTYVVSRLSSASSAAIVDTDRRTQVGEEKNLWRWIERGLTGRATQAHGILDRLRDGHGSGQCIEPSCYQVLTDTSQCSGGSSMHTCDGGRDKLRVLVPKRASPGRSRASESARPRTPSRDASTSPPRISFVSSASTLCIRNRAL